MNFAAVRLSAGRTFEIAIDAFEYVAVILSGRCNIRTNKGDFNQVGRRESVFAGMPYALYLPRIPNSRLKPSATTSSLPRVGRQQKRQSGALDHPARRGSAIARWQKCVTSNVRVIGSGFPADRILVYELYTPGGNWSSYPPHKHDTHKTDDKGNVLEAQLNRFSFFKFRSTHRLRISTCL